MGRRLATMTAAIAVLVAGLFAAPAAAQAEQECLAALQAAVGQDFTPAQLEELQDYFDAVEAGDLEGDQAEFEAFLAGLVGSDVSLDGLDPTVCTVYLVTVLPGDDDGTDADGTDADGTDADGTDADGTDADGTADDGRPRTPTQVLGGPPSRRLPFTGYDVLWLTALGAAIVGLGYVAVRRSRDQAS